ncbi:hypothetical protein BH11ARM2_BH11ARM2_27970 [soil metagenome]
MTEAFLLTGGRSVRMGRDKAVLEIDGEAQAARMVRLLTEAGISTTILGRTQVPGANLLEDDETVKGPLDALRRARPTAETAFVASCDLPRFDARLVEVLQERIGDADAAIPFVDGFRQPLVGLYRSSAFESIPVGGCPMDWLNILDVRLVTEDELKAAGVAPETTRGANTPEEWLALVGEQP